MTVQPPDDAVPLPRLVNKARRALELEARALKAALDECASITPVSGCPHEANEASAYLAASRVRHPQRRLLAAGQQQSNLILISAYDHMVSMARLLGSDGAMSLYAHTTLSRSVCEAAVRHAWLLDASISYEERITRSAAMLYADAEGLLNSGSNIRNLVPDLDTKTAKKLTGRSDAEYDQVCKLIRRAGMDLATGRTGKIARIELRNTTVKVPVKLNIGPLMATLLPEAPGWYRASSGTTHSAISQLRKAVADAEPGGEFALTTDLIEVGAAAQYAISASALIAQTHATYYGYNPEPRVRQSRQRRQMLERHMRDWIADELFERLGEYDVDGAPWSILNAVAADRRTR